MSPMSDVWHPLDPEGSRPQEPSGQDRGPDPEPIVRTVRVAFLLAGMVVAVIVNAGLNRLTDSPARTNVALFIHRAVRPLTPPR